MAAFRFRDRAINEAAFEHPKLRAVRNYVREHIADVHGPTPKRSRSRTFTRVTLNRRRPC